MDNTKSVQLTKSEVDALIKVHASKFWDENVNYTETIERMKYLDKRLKDFNEPEKPKSVSSWGDTQNG